MPTLNKIKRQVLLPGDVFVAYSHYNSMAVPTDRKMRGKQTVEAWAWAQSWWKSLTDEEKREARREAEAYEALSKEERDAVWNQFPESTEIADEPQRAIHQQAR